MLAADSALLDHRPRISDQHCELKIDCDDTGYILDRDCMCASGHKPEKLDARWISMGPNPNKWEATFDVDFLPEILKQFAQLRSLTPLQPKEGMRQNDLQGMEVGHSLAGTTHAQFPSPDS